MSTTYTDEYYKRVEICNELRRLNDRIQKENEKLLANQLEKPDELVELKRLRLRSLDFLNGIGVNVGSYIGCKTD